MSKEERKDTEEEEELFPPPRLDYYINYSNVVIVDNIPVIPKEKEEKLTVVLRKIFTQFGTLVDMFLPFEPGSQKSCGFVFIEYSNAVDARVAAEKLMNYKLDKAHMFVTNLYEDFETYDKMPLEPRPIEDLKYERPENLYDWLLDPYGCDQFVLRYGDETEIMWNGAHGIPSRSVSKEPKTDTPVQWSPKGTFLVTFHHLGVILWGGPKWKKLRKIRHNGVDVVDFSPNENYLVTYSPQYLEQDKNNNSDPQALIIWDVKTGQKLRGFNRLYPKIWPEFQWSHNDKYFSRLSKGLISVYETPSMMLLETDGRRHSIKLHASAKDHAWSPTDNYLCVYVPENLNIPARIVLIEIPTLSVIGQQAVFNVVDCHLLWQDSGDYLAVKVDRHPQKSKKKTFTSFEFFRIREKNVPVEALKLEDTVYAFAWEPKGHRFAVVHSDAENKTRPNVSFYGMEGTIRKLDTLEKRQASHLLWSPRGRFIVIFSSTGVFEFYDAENLETMAKDRQHQMVTNVTWDPTGRYVTTYVSFWKTKSENGYKIWSFRGVELTSVPKDGFLQFAWRPRPPTLLNAEQLKMLEDPVFFKKKRVEYKEEDRRKAEELHAERAREKERIRERFREYMGRKRMEYEADLAFRKSVGMEEDDEGYLVEEMVEEVLDVKEEIEG